SLLQGLDSIRSKPVRQHGDKTQDREARAATLAELHAFLAKAIEMKGAVAGDGCTDRQQWWSAKATSSRRLESAITTGRSIRTLSGSFTRRKTSILREKNSITVRSKPDTAKVSRARRRLMMMMNGFRRLRRRFRRWPRLRLADQGVQAFLRLVQCQRGRRIF